MLLGSLRAAALLGATGQVDLRDGGSLEGDRVTLGDKALTFETFDPSDDGLDAAAEAAMKEARAESIARSKA